jgi:long-chain acyl-CoA synthetase
MDKMLVEPLLAHARSTPLDIALYDDHGSYTYSHVANFAAQTSSLISQRANRQNVAVMLPSGLGFVASFYGILLAGKSVVPVNFLLGDKEVSHVLADSGVDCVITIPALAGRVKDSSLQIIDITQLPPVPAYSELPAPPKKNGGDMAVLIYTSGTSGLPKGVILTYDNLQSDLNACIKHARLDSKQRFLGVIPLFHSFGVTATLLAPMELASPVVYMGRFSPVGALNAIRNHGITLVLAVPSMYATIAHLKSAKPEDFKNTYALLSGGEPLPAVLREKFFEKFGVPLLEGYGLTETSAVAALNTPQMQRAGSVGKTVPGVVVKITGENGEALPAETIGEVWLKGPMIMKGYYNLPDATAAAINPEGFFKTGDLGKVDADGYLYITGRKKDLIIVAGEKASPREIEEALARHPAVAEAAVVGKKDSARGEVVVAFILPREGQSVTPEALRDFCREQVLPQWKIPREIYFEKELPRSPTGKILKRVLSERVNAPNQAG